MTRDQQEILREVLGADVTTEDVPQMWAMYKEVMGFFANGVSERPTLVGTTNDSSTCPRMVRERRLCSLIQVTPLLADDNWGNLMAVMPDKPHKAGGGIYYHADCEQIRMASKLISDVGDPRDYKWLSTVSLAKMWEQLNVATSFDTTQVWILNVGDLKFLETPLEWFMDIAYDSPAWNRESLTTWLAQRSRRDFDVDQATALNIAEIIADYSVSRLVFLSDPRFCPHDAKLSWSTSVHFPLRRMMSEYMYHELALTQGWNWLSRNGSSWRKEPYLYTMASRKTDAFRSTKWSLLRSSFRQT